MTSATAAVPYGIEGIDPPWLTEALGTEVDDVRSEQIAQDSGFSSLLYRLHLTGSDVPGTLIAKLPALSEARGAMELLGGYRRELAFYREVAGRAPMATPRVSMVTCERACGTSARHGERQDPGVEQWSVVPRDPRRRQPEGRRR